MIDSMAKANIENFTSFLYWLLFTSYFLWVLTMSKKFEKSYIILA